MRFEKDDEPIEWDRRGECGSETRERRSAARPVDVERLCFSCYVLDLYGPRLPDDIGVYGGVLRPQVP